MPLYCYYCPDDHETEAYRSLSERDQPIPCRKCGQQAIRAMKTHAAEETEKVESSDRLVLHEFKCIMPECENVFEEILQLSEIPELRCPECGGEVKIKIGAHTDRFSQNLYPYFDRGLGCVLHSKKERDEVCRRLGVIPVDGDFDVGRDLGVNQVKRESAEEIAAYEEYMDEVAHAEHFAPFRESIDKGVFGDPAKEALAGTFRPFRPQ